MTTTSSPSAWRVLDLGDRGDAAVDREHEVEPFRRRAASACRRSGRSPPRTATADARRRRRRARAAAGRRARSRRCRRRRSRRGRRCARRPRPRRGSSRPPRACRRARTDRGPGSAPSRNAPRCVGVGEPAADEHRSGHLVDRERVARARIARAAQGSSCQVPVAIGARVRPRSDGSRTESAATWLNPSCRAEDRCRVPARRRLACAAAPAAERTRVIPPGVSVAGVHVGGLSAEPARDAIDAALCAAGRRSPTRAAPRRSCDPTQLGAHVERRRCVSLGARSDAAAAGSRCRSAFSTRKVDEARRLARAPLRPRAASTPT